jgi:hypothetical protein
MLDLPTESGQVPGRRARRMEKSRGLPSHLRNVPPPNSAITLPRPVIKVATHQVVPCVGQVGRRALRPSEFAVPESMLLGRCHPTVRIRPVPNPTVPWSVFSTLRRTPLSPSHRYVSGCGSTGSTDNSGALRVHRLLNQPRPLRRRRVRCERRFTGRVQLENPRRWASAPGDFPPSVFSAPDQAAISRPVGGG